MAGVAVGGWWWWGRSGLGVGMGGIPVCIQWYGRAEVDL